MMRIKTARPRERPTMLIEEKTLFFTTFLQGILK
jgi:hypothetical protein